MTRKARRSTRSSRRGAPLRSGLTSTGTPSAPPAAKATANVTIRRGSIRLVTHRYGTLGDCAAKIRLRFPERVLGALPLRALHANRTRRRTQHAFGHGIAKEPLELRPSTRSHDDEIGADLLCQKDNL